MTVNSDPKCESHLSESSAVVRIVDRLILRQKDRLGRRAHASTLRGSLCPFLARGGKNCETGKNSEGNGSGDRVAAATSFAPAFSFFERAAK